MYNTIASVGSARTVSKRKHHEIVQEIVQCNNDLCICIDGLDECEESERKEILCLISRLLKIHDPDLRLRILVAARIERDIEQSLHKSLHLELNEGHTHNDIETYLRITSIKVGHKFSTDDLASRTLAREIFARVIDRPQGAITGFLRDD